MEKAAQNQNLGQTDKLASEESEIENLEENEDNSDDN